MLDTSVYGKLVMDEEILGRVKEKYESREFIIYGTGLIRKELRTTPKTIVHGAKKLRILLLNLYDSLVTKDNHNLKFNKLVEALSRDYFAEYRKNTGGLSNEAIRNDLIIVATATIYRLDIVVSDDEKTMLSDKAVKSYKSVNKKYGLADPHFKKYAQFKKELAR